MSEAGYIGNPAYPPSLSDVPPAAQEMPKEGQEPTVNIFSPQYIPKDQQPSPPRTPAVSTATADQASPKAADRKCSTCRQEIAAEKYEKMLQESPTVSRLPNKAQQALFRGIQALEDCVEKIAEETGLTPAQIVERWDVAKTRTISSWNIYQAFFRERQENELNRLDPEDRPEGESSTD